MSNTVQQVVEEIRSGRMLVAVLSPEFVPFQQAFAKEDPAGAVRGLIAWDAEDGFQAVRDVMDSPPPCLEVTQALEFIESYQGSAMFLLDGTDDAFGRQAEAVRPRLKRLVSKTALSADLTVVLVVSAPLPGVLKKYVHWVGPAGPELDRQAALADSAVTAAEDSPDDASSGKRRTSREGKGHPASHRWAEVRSLEAFDTTEWQQRLACLTPAEVQEIVNGGYHRDALERITELRSEIKGRFAQKDAIIDAISNCAVAQVPCILMGPPGTAKGHLVRSFCEGLGLTQWSAEGEESGRRYFEYQLTRFTTPEELFGPVHVQDLIDRQIYRRVTGGYLPTAHVAFLDELFKASSAILNTLLSILNERVFYNEGRPQRVPLTTIFAASNEPPQEENLSALYDRFPIRVNCPSVEDDGLGKLQERAWSDRFDRDFAADRQGLQKVACANDLRLLNKVSFVMFGGRDLKLSSDLGGGGFDTEFLRVFRMIRRDAGISDRSVSLLYAYCRANALLDGRNALNADDLDVFRHVIWGKEHEFAGFFRQLKKNYRV